MREKPRIIRVTFPPDFKFKDGPKLKVSTGRNSNVIATTRIFEIRRDEVHA